MTALQRLYFTSESGAAFTDVPPGERAHTAAVHRLGLSGYVEVTRAQYTKKRAWQRRQERREAKEEREKWAKLEAGE